jgi:hypothetical protein
MSAVMSALVGLCAPARIIAVDCAGNVYVGDAWNQTIRKATSAGVVTTLAGSHGLSGSADGSAGTARFQYPKGPAVDGTGSAA